jgi:hypothetical protein
MKTNNNTNDNDNGSSSNNNNNNIGVKGSDSRISCWTTVSGYDTYNQHPAKLVFHAWVRYNRKIYIHGGIDFGKHEVYPTTEESNAVHVLNIDTRKWSRLNNITNEKLQNGNQCQRGSPGPRSAHTMFAYKNALYVWGGNSMMGIADNKLYRLDLKDTNTSDSCTDRRLSWEVVKTKKVPPQSREGHSGVLYKQCYYITCGLTNNGGNTDDLWCLNMTTLKWSSLKRGPIERKAQGMWASNDHIYVLGGQYTDRNIKNVITANYTLDNFDSYNIKTKTWTTIKIIGVDKPYDNSEFTVLPIYQNNERKYNDQDDDDDDDSDELELEQLEPTSIIVFGGYSDLNKLNGMPQDDEMKRRYGDEARDYGQPYRNRMLRFDIQTQSWTLLKSFHLNLPLAQSFAAQITTTIKSTTTTTTGANEKKNGITEILIGKGYGTTPESKTGIENFTDEQKVMSELFLNDKKEGYTETNMLMPNYSDTLYVVSIMAADDNNNNNNNNNNDRNDDSLLSSLSTMTKQKQQQQGWAWDFFNMSDDKIPTCQFVYSPCSPTLHQIVDLSFEDFQEPPCESIQDNDESNLFGLRVQLHGLQGSSHLNGQIGRCGYWLPKMERYEIYLPSKSMSVKASNLLIAKKPCGLHDLPNIISSSGGIDPSSPTVYVMMVVEENALKKQSLMEYFTSNDFMSADINDTGFHTIMDTYHGPISRRAHAALQNVGKKSPCKSTLMLSLVASPKTRGKPAIVNQQKYRKFCLEMKEKDAHRCKKFERNIFNMKEQRDTSINIVGPWLKLVVTLDGITPVVQREIIVSPDISMQNLYHQVLCPAIGWTNNYHCYAFRRIKGDFDLSVSELRDESIKMMSNECWLGPKKSTALDNIFQFYYIGGAMANDKDISIGQLFTLDNNVHDSMNIQFVHDLGDWWSHTIHVSKYDGTVPKESSVAHLLSGHGAAPPEGKLGIYYMCGIVCCVEGLLLLYLHIYYSFCF